MGEKGVAVTTCCDSGSHMKWINVYGTIYKKPCALIVGTDNDLPLF